MTDRPAPQQRLAADLAGLVDSFPREECKTIWFAGFWEVLSERWPHTEALRMDKFLLLVRRVFAVQLRCALSNGGVASVFSQWAFEETADLRKVPLGLRLHVLDLWVDELERAGLLGDDGKEAEDLVKQLGDMVLALQTCPTKAIRERARDSYEDERLPWGSKGGDESEDGDEDEDEWGGIEE